MCFLGIYQVGTVRSAEFRFYIYHDILDVFVNCFAGQFVTGENFLMGAVRHRGQIVLKGLLNQGEICLGSYYLRRSFV